MFLNLSVILSTGRGVCLPQCMLGYTHHPGQTPPWEDTPQQTATAADRTHPTGMHSCLNKYLSKMLWQNPSPCSRVKVNFLVTENQTKFPD